MNDFEPWRASVISQIAFMLTDCSAPSLATTFFERHRKASKAAWTRGEEALLWAIEIVNAERDLAKTLEAEKREQALRDGAEGYFEREAELVEHWRQDCLDNGLI